VSAESHRATRGKAAISGVESFGDFYRREYPLVVRVAFVLTGRIDLAEEATQDAFVDAYRRWDRVASYDDPAGWVRRVATNRCISGYRKRTNEARALLRLSRRAATQVPEVGSEVWVALRSLPRRQAQVLALMFVEDRTISDIARLLGCGEETARTHARRGRQSLARILRIEENEL